MPGGPWPALVAARARYESALHVRQHALAAQQTAREQVAFRRDVLARLERELAESPSATDAESAFPLHGAGR
jgi:hypothetical protein